MIGDEHQQFWMQLSLNRMAVNRALEAIQNMGKSLPCVVTAIEGSIVTVEFYLDTSPWLLPSISIPKLESPWMRSPTQIGDTGLAVPAGTFLGGISGLGSGLADMRNPGNLAALYFVPISYQYSPPPNIMAATVQGPDGAIIRTTLGTESSVVVSATGTVITFGSVAMDAGATSTSMMYGTNSVVLDGISATTTVGSSSTVVTDTSITMTAGGMTVTLDSTGLNINGILFDTHTHPYAPGSGTVTETGTPV